jgi:YD repeat-containing protein
MRPLFSHTSALIRLTCFVLCYSLVTPLPAFTRRPSAAIARAAAPAAPAAKTNVARTTNQTIQKARWRDSELLVRFHEHAPVSKLNQLLRTIGAQWNGQLRGQSNIERLHLSAGADPEIVAASLRTSEWVDFAEPNYLITADQTPTQTSPNDPRFSEQWALRSTGTPQAWAITTGSKQTVIAIIDSDIDFTHPDLSNNEWDNSLERDNNRDDDGNGFNADLHGWDFITNTGTVIDKQGHGTAIAGIIAAQGNNATGISGVMWRASLMSLRVLDSTGTGDVAHAVEAIDYAVDNGAQVINCSWGTDDLSNALREAISRAALRGVIVVTSAGNQGRDIETTPRYPASFDLPNLIPVASTDSNDLLTSFSNWGMLHASIAAPGKDILTTKIGGDYQTISGSSASTAFVTGVAGLVKSLRPWLGADRTREMILRGARPIPGLADKVASKGILNTAGVLGTLDTLPASEGLDESGGNNGGEHGNNGSGQSNQRATRPDAGNNGNHNGNRQRDGHEFSVTPLAPTLGAPGPGLPDLDLLRRQQPIAPKAAPPIPSTRCAHHNPQCTKEKHQATLDVPTNFLAWNNSFQIQDFLAGHISGSISDSALALKSPSLTNYTSGNTGFPLLPQSSSTNLALGKPTMQSSDPGWGGMPGKAVDGNTDGTWADGSVTHTDSNAQAWWQVDLGQVGSIQNIQVWNRTDCCNDRLQNFYVLVSDNPFTSTNLTTTINQAGVSSYYMSGIAGVTTNMSVNRTGRYVRVQLSGTNYLSLAEVEVFGTVSPSNLALNKSATQSSDPGWGGPPSKAVDGNTDGAWANNSVTHTNNDSQAWWQVDLGAVQSIGTIKVWNRTDCCGDRLSNFYVLVSDSPFQFTSLTATLNQSGVSSYYTVGQGGSPTTITMNPGQMGRYVRVQLTGSNYLSLAEVQVWEGTSDSFSIPRLNPGNRTGSGGVDLLSGNANWSLPILGLKGRAGLDLGLSLSYNSLVWTKSQNNTSIKFDADRGFPGPGFRLGFPFIQPRYISQAGANAYLLITPSGDHIELKQVGTSNTYESADSSYLQLTDYGNGSLTLRPTDGSQLSYNLMNGQYQCVQLKDRNGNYISISYYSDGRINTVTDTLSRVITFNYDSLMNLTSITQTWGGMTHTWATFGWSNLTLNTSFKGMAVVGPQNGSVIPVLTQVGLDDGSRYNFEYNSYAQVYLVRHYAFDNHQRSYSLYTLPASSTDCPRVTESHEWVENWNNDQEAITAYTLAADHSSGQVTMPDGTIYKELYATTGWQKGLTTGTEFWSGGVKKKWTTTAWTQDDISAAFQKNPRVTETNIYDSDTNHKRTTVDYGSGSGPGSGQYAQYGLPYVVTEYAADGTTPLRYTFTDYNLDPVYANQRIIGLVSAVHISNGSAWQSKTVYAYDAGGDQLQATPGAATQHDDANYGTGFTARGNITSVSRYDVTDISNDSKALTTRIGYDTDGSVIFSRDPLNHQASI